MKRRTKTISSLFTVLVIVLSVQVAHAELVGLWKFDEGFGDTVFDSSGYGRNGTLYGGQPQCDAAPPSAATATRSPVAMI